MAWLVLLLHALNGGCCAIERLRACVGGGAAQRLSPLLLSDHLQGISGELSWHSLTLCQWRQAQVRRGRLR